MDKQALIPLEEYNQLLKLKENYEILIKELENKENVVLVDRRFGYNPYKTDWHDTQTPKIVCGEKLAKDYLQEEFDNLFKHLQNAKEDLIKKNNKIIEQQNKLDKKWWK